MKKRSISIISLITLFSINLISAQYGYNSFSLPDLLGGIDPQSMVLLSVFALATILIFWPLSRVIKDSYGRPNTTIALTIALISSALITYGMNRSGFDVESLFYGLGISPNLLYIISLIILLIGAFFLIKKVKFSGFFMLVGLLLIILALLTDIFYEDFWVLVLGTLLLLIGIIWWWRKRRKKRRGQEPEEPRGATGPPGPPRPTGPIGPSSSSGGPRRSMGRGDRMNLTRSLGITKLQKELTKLSQEYQVGIQTAGGLHKKATQLGWTKAGTKPRAGETPQQTKKRAREASDTYKTWYRQYSRNIQLDKEIRKIQERMIHLRNKLR